MMARVRSIAGFVVAVAAVVAPVFFLVPVSVDGDEQLGLWRALANLNLNAYHLWRSDPVSRVSAGLLSQPVAAVQMVIMLCGTWLGLRQHSPLFARSPGFRWVASAIPCVAVSSFVGLDRFVIGSFAWVPLLSMMLFALLNATRASYATRVLPLWVMALFVSVQNSTSANQASVFSALIALLIARYFWERSPERRTLSLLEAFAVTAVALIPAACVAVSCPVAALPAYPHGAHVVPESGTDTLPYALIGPSYPLATLDRVAAAQLYLPGSVLLVTLALVLLVTVGRSASPNQKRLQLFTLAVASCLVLDAALPYDLSLIAPLATLSRLLPWGTVISVISLGVGVVAWLVAVAALSHPSRVVTALATASTLLGWAAAPADLFHPALAAHLTPTAEPEVRRLIASPSSAVVRTYLRQDPLFFEHLAHYRQFKPGRMRDLVKLGGSYSLEPSVQRGEPGEAGQPHLSTGHARQAGGEVCTARLPREMPLSAIELSPGRNLSDFPRGVRVSGGACDRASAKPIVDIPRWQGPLRFTADGFPFWAQHPFVQILFPTPVTVECVFIEQTGTASYDWTIEQVKVLAGS